MAKPSPYLKERISTHRAKKLSYGKIRLELEKVNFKVSKISIGKICIIRLRNEHSFINNKLPDRNFTLLKYIKLHNLFSIVIFNIFFTKY